jgi:cytochrome c-type biogenesis protein CcmH/NrfG
MSHNHAIGKQFVLMLWIFLSASSFAQTQPAREQIRRHAERAEQALQENRLDAAAAELHAILAIDPKNAQALGLLGICDKRQAKASARTELENSFARLKNAKLRMRVGLELMDLYDQQGDQDRSIPVMRALVALNPDDANILYFAQHLYSELADDTLNKLAIIAPDSARMQQTIAEHLVNAGDLPNAIIHYRKAIAIDPHLPGMHFELAEAILESAPSNAQARSEAIKENETAVQSDGDSAKSECLFGRIALQHGDFDQALTRYSSALKMNPSEVEAQLGMARVLMVQEKEKPENAVKYLAAAIVADPLNEEAHYRLAKIYKRTGRNADAEKEMKLFQEIKQTKSQVREIYQQMSKPAPPQTNELPDNLSPDSSN